MRHDATRVSAALLALCLPSAALACGGFFCDNAQPVIQAGERILFATDGEQTEMHVQITYDGPPSEFGWLLPAPPDVDVGLSSQALFPALDALLRPVFRLTPRFADCGFGGVGGQGGAGGFGGEGEGEGEGEGPRVDVLERRALGPFDQATLRADSVDVLVEWLVENGYQRPEGAEEILADYVGTSVFVALKLQADADVGDIRPIRFRYTAPTMAVPLRPTSVAAANDMGILVYVLGAARAVPTNYLHVEINPAVLDWELGPDNYPDVVSAAVDEAGGRAFVTDASIPVDGRVRFEPADLDLEGLAATEVYYEALATWNRTLNQADVVAVLGGFLTPPEGVDVADVLRCPGCYEDVVIGLDGAGLAAVIRDELLPTWRALDGLFTTLPHITRLYTTMSPHEMTVDPMFALNRDLPPVDPTREATVWIGCDGDRTVEVDGLRYDSSGRSNGEAVRRVDGETVRGEGPAARRIQRMMAAGEPETVTDNTDDIAAHFRSPLPEAFEPSGGGAVGGFDSGCNCDAGDGGLPSTLGLLLLTLLGIRRWG